MSTAAEHAYGDEIDLAKLFAIVWAGKRWVIASVVLFTGLFAGIAVVSTPIYRASTVLVSVSENSSLSGDFGSTLGSLGSFAAVAGLNFGTRAGREEEALAILKSRQFLENFIRQKNLMPLLFDEEWDTEARSWKDPTDPPTLAQAHKYFVKSILSIDDGNDSGLVTIQVEWKDREQAAEWANELVARLNEEMRTRAAEKASASIRFLEAEAKRTTLVGTQEAIARLMETQINQGMLANVTREYAFRVVDPAMPPDKDDPAKPEKPLIAAAGFMLGAVIGVFGVLGASGLSWLRAAGSQRQGTLEAQC